MFDVDELMNLEEKLRFILDERMEEILVRLNREGRLEELFDLLGLSELIGRENNAHTKNGKIVIIGQSEVGEDKLIAIAKNMGIERNRLEFWLDYDDAKTFDFRKTQWSPEYTAILVGPMPHSGTSKGDYSSVISALEQQDGYPPVIRMGNNGLKITKTSFRSTLETLKKERLIA